MVTAERRKNSLIVSRGIVAVMLRKLSALATVHPYAR